MKKTIVSEYVSWGHPDKIADQISDAILDAYLSADTNVRAGIETMVKDNVVVLGGEINSNAYVDYNYVVRKVFSEIKFPESHHLNPDNIKIINLIGKQSTEIHSGVDKEDGEIGAGDQGFVVGYASNETQSYLPLGYFVAKKLCQFVAGKMGNTIGPDVKTQVIVEYDCGISKIVSILVSAMHQCDIDLLRTFIVRCIVDNEVGFEKQIIDKIRNDNTEITVNPCGTWNIGGPISDCGVTGRKIVVDQYGGYCSVGGGAFSGKDMTKVDRSASYMARYIAKNIVASGLCNTAKVELSYMIGIAKPSSINIEMDENQHLAKRIIEYIDNNIDCTPSGIMKRFKAEVPRNQYLAKYGHFGDASYDSFHYPWEVIDFANDLFNYANAE